MPNTAKPDEWRTEPNADPLVQHIWNCLREIPALANDTVSIDNLINNIWHTTILLDAERANLASDEAQYWTKLEANVAELETLFSSYIAEAEPALAAMNVATVDVARSWWLIAYSDEPTFQRCVRLAFVKSHPFDHYPIEYLVHLIVSCKGILGVGPQAVLDFILQSTPAKLQPSHQVFSEPAVSSSVVPEKLPD